MRLFKWSAMNATTNAPWYFIRRSTASTGLTQLSFGMLKLTGCGH